MAIRGAQRHANPNFLPPPLKFAKGLGRSAKSRQKDREKRKHKQVARGVPGERASRFHHFFERLKMRDNRP